MILLAAGTLLLLLAATIWLLFLASVDAGIEPDTPGEYHLTELISGTIGLLGVLAGVAGWRLMSRGKKPSQPDVSNVFD